ncbi:MULTISPECIES: phage Gp19/Gp15/Gp42 family protein [Lactobacillales]|uniref:phage Gp19/Gp15/Gp42 family protein n=1 Tax=Lactobacillales TaxID=186826 RepID=UPI00026C8690|nr:phage Gp19/Gp15/Gp42 family protein [Carnobacterium maltaromaticum]
MQPFATVEELQMLWRELKNSELERAMKLLEVVSDTLRVEANRTGKNIDNMMLENPSYTNVVKSVTVDVVARTLMTSTDQEPMTQYSEGALGYQVSGSYLVPGGGLFIKNAELARLGLRRQRIGGLDFYGETERNHGYFS